MNFFVICNVLFFSGYEIFFLYLVFIILTRCAFINIYPKWGLLNFLNLYIFVFYQIWDSLCCLLSDCFSASFFLSSSRMYTRPLENVSVVPETNLFNIPFSQFLKLNDFYSSVFKFTNSYLHSAAKPFMWILKFQKLCFSGLRFPFSSVL